MMKILILGLILVLVLVMVGVAAAGQFIAEQHERDVAGRIARGDRSLSRTATSEHLRSQPRGWHPESGMRDDS